LLALKGVYKYIFVCIYVRVYKHLFIPSDQILLVYYEIYKPVSRLFSKFLCNLWKYEYFINRKTHQVETLMKAHIFDVIDFRCVDSERANKFIFSLFLILFFLCIYSTGMIYVRYILDCVTANKRLSISRSYYVSCSSSTQAQFFGKYDEFGDRYLLKSLIN
jgi:hypothetical protein